MPDQAMPPKTNQAVTRPEQHTIGPLGVLDPPEIHVECPAFNGSLAMLFVCVREKKIDLLDIPLAPICEAYLRYVLGHDPHQPPAPHQPPKPQTLPAQNEQPSPARSPDLEAAAVALAALSYLVERKAWALIPVPPSEEPDDDGLLEESAPFIQEFVPAIESLLDLREERERLFFRNPEAAAPYEVPFDTSAVSASDLARAFEQVLARALPDPPAPLGKPRRSLSEQMAVVLRALPETPQDLLQIISRHFNLAPLHPSDNPQTQSLPPFTRSEAVWWFLALLELIRLAQARVVVQDQQPLFAKGAAS